jgi:hypothetical protein
MKKPAAPLRNKTVKPSLDKELLSAVLQRLMRETNGCNSDATALIGVLDGRQIHLTITTDKHAFLRTSKDKCLTFTETAKP